MIFKNLEEMENYYDVSVEITLPQGKGWILRRDFDNWSFDYIRCSSLGEITDFLKLHATDDNPKFRFKPFENNNYQYIDENGELTREKKKGLLYKTIKPSTEVEEYNLLNIEKSKPFIVLTGIDRGLVVTDFNTKKFKSFLTVKPISECVFSSDGNTILCIQNDRKEINPPTLLILDNPFSE